MPEKVPNKPKWGADEYVQEMYPKPEKTVTYKHETFDCKWCGKAYELKQSKAIHETWCKNNPNHRIGNPKIRTLSKEGKKEESPLKLNVSKPKTYTIEDIREIDKIIGLSADQIAKFVRGEKKDA